MNTVIEGVWSDDDISELQKRNKERAAAAKDGLGTRYICHPSRRVQRLDPIRSRFAGRDYWQHVLSDGVVLTGGLS